SAPRIWTSRSPRRCHWTRFSRAPEFAPFSLRLLGAGGNHDSTSPPRAGSASLAAMTRPSEAERKLDGEFQLYHRQRRARSVTNVMCSNDGEGWQIASKTFTMVE